MSDVSLRSSIIVAAVSSVLSSVLTLGGGLMLQSYISEKSEAERFAEGAQLTFQETVVLLNEGYLALKQLQWATDGKGWEEVKDGPWLDYMEFNRQWNQKLIAHYFKIERYFGTGAAKKLVDLSGASDSNVLAADTESYNFRDHADAIEYSIRRAAISRMVFDKEGAKILQVELIDHLEDDRQNREEMSGLMGAYQKNVVDYSRGLDGTLDQLGVKRVVAKAHQ